MEKAGGDFNQHYRPPVLRAPAPFSHLSSVTTTTAITHSVGQQGQLGLAPVTLATGLQGPMSSFTSTPGLPVHRQAVSLGQLPVVPVDNPRAQVSYRKSPHLIPVPPAPLTANPGLALLQAPVIRGQQIPAPQSPQVTQFSPGQWSAGVDGTSRPSTAGQVRWDDNCKILGTPKAAVVQTPAFDAMELLFSAVNSNVITRDEARLLVNRRLYAESGQNANRSGEPAPCNVQWADNIVKAKTPRKRLMAAPRPPVTTVSPPRPPMYPTQAQEYQDPPGAGGPPPGRTPRGQSYDDYLSQGPGPKYRKKHYDDERAGWKQYDSIVHPGGNSNYRPVSPRAPARGETPAYLNLKPHTVSRNVQADRTQPPREDVDIDPMNVSRKWPSSYAPDSTYAPHYHSDYYDSYRDDYSDSDPMHNGESALEWRRLREAEAALKNLIFDGEEKSESITWEFFADRFKLAAETARWDARALKLRLMSCLRGGASRTISHLTGEATFLDVWDALRRRYSVIGQETSFEVKLAESTRDMEKDTPQAYLDDVTYLCRNAYPRSSESDLQEAVMKYFLLGHPEAYQNHLNAAVNFRTGTTEDLLQACRQYEQIEIHRKNVSAKRPAVGQITSGFTGKSRRKDAALAPLDLCSSCTESEDGDSALALDILRTATKKSRRRYPKHAKTKLRASTAVRAVEPYSGSPARTGKPVEDWVESFDLTDSEEELMDELIALISAGHGFKFCPKLLAEYPDGRIPPKIALVLFQRLMNFKSARNKPRSNPRSGPRDRQSKKKKLLAIAAPAEDTSGYDLDDLSLNSLGVLM